MYMWGSEDSSEKRMGTLTQMYINMYIPNIGENDIN